MASGEIPAGESSQLRPRPAKTIVVAYQVHFYAPLDEGKGLTLCQRTDRVTYTRSGSENFKADRRHSTVSEAEIEEFYDIQDSADVLPEDFLKFNKAPLRAIARGPRTAQRDWLTAWLKTAPDTPESRELRHLLSATTPSRP